MKKLDVLFSDKVNLQIDDIKNSIETNISKSVIARAAMQIGLRNIKEHGNIDESYHTVDEWIVINNLKAKN